MSPHLSFEIQIEIIKRLPVRSLVQFRWVCKAWKSFIESSDFIAGYDVPTHDQPQNLMISYREPNDQVKHVCFVDDDTFPQQKFFLTIPHLAREATAIGSSHGLLCFISHLQEPDDTSKTQIAIIWNPAIRKSIAVVVPNFTFHKVTYPCDQESDNVSVYEESDNVIGFGVCPETKDPKLVNITYPDYEDLCEVMVFTLSSGEWRTSRSNLRPRISLVLDNNCQTAIGRYIYWFARDDSALVDDFYLIMSFDLSTDEFREIQLPHSLNQSNSTISKLRESLVVLDDHVNQTTKNNVFGVWMMKHRDYQKTFTKLFTIEAPGASVWSTLCFRNNGEAIIGMQSDEEVKYIQSVLAVYEPCSKQIKDLGIHARRISVCCGNSYTESLLLLDHDDGHVVKCGAVKS